MTTPDAHDVHREGPLDERRFVDHVAAWVETARRAGGRGGAARDVEVYARVARRRRFELERAGDLARRGVVLDRGVAVRWAPDGPPASSTFDGLGAIEDAAARALVAGVAPSSAPVAARPIEPLVDRAAVASEPVDDDASVERLRSAVEAIEREAPPGAVVVDRAELVLGRVDEWLGSTCGGPTWRTRSRSRAVLDVAIRTGRPTSRTFELAVDAAAGAIDTRELATALAWTARCEGRCDPGSLGPIRVAPHVVAGWLARWVGIDAVPDAIDVVDRATVPGGWFEGRFDDVGRPVRDHPIGPDRAPNAWRSSYRDAPVPVHAHLRIERGTPVEAPSGVPVLIDAIDMPVDDDRVRIVGTVVDPERARDAAGAARTLDGVVSMRALARRVVGATGPPVATNRGVTAVELLVDGFPSP